MKRLLLALLVLIMVAAGVYGWWTTTPFYAFQEAYAAAREHDLQKFEERVDLRGFVDNLVDDLLVLPAQTTPGLSRTQRQVSNGAIALARGTIEEQLIYSIERSIAGNRRNSVSFLFGDAAMAGELFCSNDLGDLLKVTAHEVTGSVGRLKQVVFQRMQLYAQAHRHTVPGRLLGCRPQMLIVELKQMLAEDGLTPQNFRGISSYNTSDNGSGGEISQIGLKFFSPKVNQEVTIQVELSKGSMFSLWQVKRLVDLPQFFLQEGENYDYEMHMLMASALSGISDQAVNSEVQGATRRITESQAAQNLLKKWNIKIK